MKKYITILACLFSLYSCSGSEDNFHDNIQSFFVLDKDGNDLLDPDNKNVNAIHTENIKVYYLMDGEKQMSFSGVVKLWTDPMNPSDNLKYYSFMIGLNTYGKNGSTSETYIEWGENDVDTIYSRVVRSDNYLLVRTTKVNDSI